MEFNKTKRGLEKAASIIGIIWAVLCLIVSVYIIAISWQFYKIASIANMFLSDDVTYDYWLFFEIIIIIGILYYILAILLLISSIKLVNNPFNANGELKKRTATRIWVLVLSILSGNFIIVGLMIAVLCLKDFKVADSQNVQSKQNPYMESSQRLNDKQDFHKKSSHSLNDEQDFYKKIQELKHLKSSGIIDEETYKKAINKIVQEMAKE